MPLHHASFTSLLEALSSEVVRKLRLAGEADTKDDRDIICEEVFCDVTGLLDETAQAQLGAPARVPFYVVLAQHYASPRGADSAVAVLHLLQSLYGQGYAAPLLALLLHRWLLLRKAPGRGLPEEQRTRLANVLALGSAQLFLGDVHGGARTFEPLWRTLCYEVILGAPESLVPPLQPSQHQQQHQGSTPSAGRSSQGTSPSSSSPTATAAAAGAESQQQPQGVVAGGRPASSSGAATGLATLSVVARTGVLASVASYLVYYVRSDELSDVLCHFPSPSAPPSPSLPTPVTTSQPQQQQQEQGGGSSSSAAKSSNAAAGTGRTGAASAGQPSSSSGGGAGGGAAAAAVALRRPPLASPPWHGVDFVLQEVVDTLMRIRSEAGLVHYLGALQRLGGQPVLQQWGALRLDTRLRLQGTLYSLSSPGGPHYAPPTVRSAALAALDSLFPAGRTSRYLVRMLFRLLHPADWLGDVIYSPLALVRSALSRLALSCFLLLHSLVLWGAWGSARREQRSGERASGKRGGGTANGPAQQRQPHVVGGGGGGGDGSSAAATSSSSSGQQQQQRAWAGGDGEAHRRWTPAPMGGGPQGHMDRGSLRADADAAAAHLAASHPR